MNSPFATYFSGTISNATTSESLLAPFTPPYKYSYNQIVSRSNAAQGYILALPLGIQRARCVTPFLCANS